MSAFEDLGVMEDLAIAVADMDWTLPTDIQSEAIPEILGGADVLMVAGTGSGKTGAFSLPILQVVHESMSQAMKSGGEEKPHAAAKGGAEKWRMSIFDRDISLNMDDSGLLCESQHHRQWSGARATKGIKGGSGQFYYEARIESDGLCRMGWSTAAAALNLGTDQEGFGFGGNGKKSSDLLFEQYGESFTNQDVIGCYLSLTDRTVRFSKNGKMFPVAFHLPHHLMKKTLFPAVLIKNSRLRLNFGDGGPMQYPPSASSGYVPVAQALAEQQVSQVWSTPSSKQKKLDSRRPTGAPVCVILEPTKELAQQTHDELGRFKKYLRNPEIRTALVDGGISMGEQLKMLEAGVDIITCTPGRIRDLVQTNTISLDYVRFFVIDEANSLCSNPDGSRTIAELHSKIPTYSLETGEEAPQMIVCSATFHNPDVRRLADTYMRSPKWIDLKRQEVVPEAAQEDDTIRFELGDVKVEVKDSKDDPYGALRVVAFASGILLLLAVVGGAAGISVALAPYNTSAAICLFGATVLIVIGLVFLLYLVSFKCFKSKRVVPKKRKQQPKRKPFNELKKTQANVRKDEAGGTEV